MGRTRFVLPAVMLLSLVIACNENNTLGLGDSSGERFTALLSGEAVRPAPVSTTATGTASLTVLEPGIGSSQRSLGYTLTVTNLTEATEAHIHLGGGSQSFGPILLTLYSNPGDTLLSVGSGVQLVSTTIAESLIPVGLDSLMKLMRAGAAYVDIHSTSKPIGVIRGQITSNGKQAPGDLFAASPMTGANERPIPVTSTATGSATFELIDPATIRYQVSVTGLTGATMAHLHTGAADSAGPIAVTLFTTSTPIGQLSGTLASGTFTVSNIQLPGVSLDSLLTLMRSGRTYVNVHTVLNPNGEIRAQVEPVSSLPSPSRAAGLLITH